MLLVSTLSDVTCPGKKNGIARKMDKGACTRSHVNLKCNLNKTQTRYLTMGTLICFNICNTETDRKASHYVTH